jgi:hypothetical protein
MNAQTCAREGCSKTVPEIAQAHGDPYCSTGCSRAARGLNPDNAKPLEADVEPAAGLAALHHGTYDPSDE